MAPPAAPPSAVQFNDWRLGCERRAEGRDGTCFIEQRISRNDQPDRIVLAIAVGFFAPGGKAAMIVKVPPTAEIEAGIAIRVDDRPQREVGIRGCNAENCTVAALLDDAMVREMKAGSSAAIAYKLKDKDDAVLVPVSLMGFTKGLAELQKR